MNSTYFLNLTAGNIFGSQSNPAIPSEYYLGLSTTLPEADGTNVSEPSGNAYARVAIASSLGTPSGGVVTNTAPIYFSEATGNWGALPYYVIYDAATGGNLLIYGELSSSVSVGTNTTFWVKTGQLSLSTQNPT